ncbi:MAG: nucleotidyltransferase domain-containing protein [Blautia sp.]|nr:nucleotidyltransferase domain-containing protein [Blautia sp.]
MPTIEQIKEQINPVFRKHGVKKAVLFGSFAKGNATEKSDVDLLVDSGLKGLKFVYLLDDVQRSIGREVDMLDITHIERGTLLDEEIDKSGVVIYEE